MNTVTIVQNFHNGQRVELCHQLPSVCSIFRELKKYQEDFSSWCGECQWDKRERQQLSVSATKEELLKKDGEPGSKASLKFYGNLVK